MSAFLVSDNTMNNVVNYISRHSDYFAGFRTCDCDGLDKLGTALFAMNQRALKARYNDDAYPPVFKYRPVTPIPNVQAFKSIQCLLYQCSEGNIPDEPLYKAVEELKHELAIGLICETQAYNTATWD